MFDEVRSPAQAGAIAEYGRNDASMGSSLHPTTSANRKGSQITSNSHSNTLITSGGARVGTEVNPSAMGSGLKPLGYGGPSG